MATPPLVLEIVQGGTTLTFHVPPRLNLRRVARFKEASEPPEVQEFADVLSCTDAVLVSTDGTTATLWTQLATLLGTPGSRSVPMTSVKVKTSGGTTLLDLTGSTYEVLRLEEIELSGDPGAYEGLDHGAFRTVARVNLQVSAVLAQADSNGIVSWDQQVSYDYVPGGLLRITWVTTIGVAKGTSGGAAGKLATYGLIPIATWGDSYRYLTNGDAGPAPGVNVQEVDADEQNSWEATRAVGTCVLQQGGLSMGTTAPALTPDVATLEIETDRSPAKTTITYTATAQGPGAQAWCEAQIPTGLAISRTVVYEEQMERVYRIRWEQGLEGQAAGGITTVVRIQMSGGAPDPQFEPAAGGFDPVLFTTAVLPWLAVVSIVTEGVGKNTAKLLPFPRPLGGPFLLIPSQSTEDSAPYPVDGEAGKAVGDTLYRREARLVYGAATRPDPTFADEILGGSGRIGFGYLGQASGTRAGAR